MKEKTKTMKERRTNKKTKTMTKKMIMSTVMKRIRTTLSREAQLIQTVMATRVRVTTEQMRFRNIRMTVRMRMMTMMSQSPGMV